MAKMAPFSLFLVVRTTLLSFHVFPAPQKESVFHWTSKRFFLFPVFLAPVLLFFVHAQTTLNTVRVSSLNRLLHLYTTLRTSTRPTNVGLAVSEQTSEVAEVPRIHVEWMNDNHCW